MLDDSTGPQQYHLQIYPIVITDNITVYLFKFSQYRNITKRLGTGFNHPPPLLSALVQTVGQEFTCTSKDLFSWDDMYIGYWRSVHLNS